MLERPPHVQHDLAIGTAGHVLGRLVLDVFRAPEFARPPSVRQLPRGVSVEVGVAVEGQFLEAGFRDTVPAGLTLQRYS